MYFNHNTPLYDSSIISWVKFKSFQLSFQTIPQAGCGPQEVFSLDLLLSLNKIMAIKLAQPQAERLVIFILQLLHMLHP